MQRPPSSFIPFKDKNQNFWQLASIQSAALGLPGILIGGEIASKFGSGIAIGSILIGNLILWLIGLATIGMTEYGANAVENVGNYLGPAGRFAFALVIGSAFIGWYTIQSKAGATIIAPILGAGLKQQIRIGAVLGILIALSSMGGIRFIKWLNVACLPLLFSFFIFLALIHHIDFHNFNIEASLFGVLSTISVTLPGIINLPTFFRHSKSKPHAFLALTVMTIIVSIFQCFSVLMGVSSVRGILNLNISPIIVVAFTVMLLFCINTVNIYLASGVLEVVFRRAADAKDYAILGLLGTGSFVLLQALPLMSFFENSINGCIASLGAVLISVFLIKIIVLHRPRLFEKIISNACWFIGCFTSLVLLIRNPQQPNRALLYAFGISALSLLIMLFIEETIWSFNNSSLRRRYVTKK